MMVKISYSLSFFSFIKLGKKNFSIFNFLTKKIHKFFLFYLFSFLWETLSFHLEKTLRKRERNIRCEIVKMWIFTKTIMKACKLARITRLFAVWNWPTANTWLLLQRDGRFSWVLQIRLKVLTNFFKLQ